MTEQQAEIAQMNDAEVEAWDDLWDTDAARCCSCPSCNFYAPDYEQHKHEPCLLRTTIERIVSERVKQALRAAAEALPDITEGNARVGTSAWSESARDIYSLAIEEAQSALRELAEEADNA